MELAAVQGIIDGGDAKPSRGTTAARGVKRKERKRISAFVRRSRYKLL